MRRIWAKEACVLRRGSDAHQGKKKKRGDGPGVEPARDFRGGMGPWGRSKLLILKRSISFQTVLRMARKDVL